MGYALLEVRQPGRKPLVLAIQHALELGRDCDGLLLMDPEVSRRHAAVRLDGDALTIEDLGSTNGTTLNGQPLERPTKMTEADVARLGSTELRMVQEPAIAAAPGAGPSRGTVVASGDTAVVRARAGGSSAARQTSIDVVASAAEQETFDASRLQAEGGTVTIVFSDIEGSTEAAMKLGDTAWFRLLGLHNDIVRGLVRDYRGKEVKSQGDGFMLTFPSARAAVRCTSEVQRRLAAHAGEHPDEEIRVRIGIHTGEAIADATGDLFGRHIIVAARIANLADGGQILASGITKEIAHTGDFRFGAPRQVSLKGIEGDQTVYEVLWHEDEEGR
ncbi:MAG: adenylate/guanylate cyclase domain-containing protein [Acidimicrobiia bacterium]